MTLESFSCVFCQSKEFDRVADWQKHSLQAIVVYVKYLFMFQNDYKRLGHSVICSIDYWLLYVNRKFKWYEYFETRHPSDDSDQVWFQLV
jgi:hypothetical protein